ncbi:MAG: hypothetical protein ACFE85_15960, partial [Candidatus Hodarchaeota archaeon]
MESKNQIIEQLKRILKESQILTDLEDTYVYSFEKIFLNKVYPKPDIVVRVFSSKEEKEVVELAEKFNAALIKRGEEITPVIRKSSNTIILIDNVKIPKLENCIDNIEKIDADITNLDKFHINGYGTYRNLALAVQNLLFGKTLNKCQQCITCSGYCTVAP